jgi:hypothetical protein
MKQKLGSGWGMPAFWERRIETAAEIERLSDG